MWFFRFRSRCASWIAILAVLFAALAPAASHAIESGRGASWIEICGAQGPQRILIDDRGEPLAPATAQVFEHCAYCTLHAADLALQPVPVLVLPACACGPAQAARPDRAAPAAAEWPGALSRAPPACS